MSDTLYEIYIHIIFGTHNGEKLIPKNVLSNLHAYVASIFSKNQCHDICVGGISNHIHILTSSPKTVLIPELIKNIKVATNKMLINKYELNSFKWQKGYAVFSVSPTEISKVKNYIKNQEKHHIQTSYEKELKYLQMLCNRLDIALVS